MLETPHTREDGDAKGLHSESIIVDNNHYGPIIYSSKMMEMVGKLLSAGTPAAAVWDEVTNTRIQELVMNPDFLQEYLGNWDRAGVTAICYSLFSLSDPYSFASTVKEIAQLIFLLDSLPDKFVKITRSEDLRKAKSKGKRGIIMFVENTEQFGKKLDNIDVFYQYGLRIVQLTYNSRNWVGNGCTERTDEGLSSFGLEVVERLNKLRMLIDLSHCGYRTTLDAIENSREPVVFTHTFAKALSNHDRGKTDEQLKALAEKGGYAGVMIVPFFITRDTPATMEHFLGHIDYIANLIGVDHVAIGTDWYPPAHEGLARALNHAFASIGFRREHRIDYGAAVKGFEDWSEWPNITSGLFSRGYSRNDVKKILGGNFVRVFERVVG